MNRTPKAKPILMNSEMVLATLNGQKTQTRRIMTLQSEIKTISDLAGIACPHGDIGDLLYVRETFQGPLVDEEDWDAFAKNREQFESPDYCSYKASGDSAEFYHLGEDEIVCRWKPSIHMPRWASRLTLRITDIWAQQVQDIGENDAIAEGFDLSNTEAAQTEGWYEKPQRSFQRIWEQLYGKENWSQNPWAWVIEFEAINKNVDQVLKELETAA